MPGTARQQVDYALTKEVMRKLNIAQWTYYHRGLSGTLTPGATADVYAEPGAVQDVLAGLVGIPVFVSLMQQQIRGSEINAGDTAGGQEWTTRSMAQVPLVYSDAGDLLTFQDDDLIQSPSGTVFKVENPTISHDEGFFTFSLVLYS